MDFAKVVLVVVLVIVLVFVVGAFVDALLEVSTAGNEAVDEWQSGPVPDALVAPGMHAFADADFASTGVMVFDAVLGAGSWATVAGLVSGGLVLLFVLFLGFRVVRAVAG